MAQIIPIRGTTDPAQHRPRYKRVERRCTTPGCITILSRFNPGPRCFAHDRPPRVVADSIERLMQEIPRRLAA